MYIAWLCFCKNNTKGCLHGWQPACKMAPNDSWFSCPGVVPSCTVSVLVCGTHKIEQTWWCVLCKARSQCLSLYTEFIFRGKEASGRDVRTLKQLYGEFSWWGTEAFHRSQPGAEATANNHMRESSYERILLFYLNPQMTTVPVNISNCNLRRAGLWARTTKLSYSWIPDSLKKWCHKYLLFL